MSPLPGQTPRHPIGIGSTAVVALEQGRNVVGFELKESYHAASLDYVKAQRKRMANAERQGDLFARVKETVP